MHVMNGRKEGRKTAMEKIVGGFVKFVNVAKSESVHLSGILSLFFKGITILMIVGNVVRRIVSVTLPLLSFLRLQLLGIS